MDEIDNFGTWAYEDGGDYGRVMFVNKYDDYGYLIESIYKDLSDNLSNIDENSLRVKDVSNNTFKNIVQSFYYNLSGEKNYFILVGVSNFFNGLNTYRLLIYMFYQGILI